ncbi:MAG: phosphatidylinositol-specific phospholipase C domain-containing protein [Lachnospiraceae bacterium]|nr:phosphatidylinositol-specific phospholipase C domain-containing protein [Lachnospiraceae bacterium]
MHKSGSRSAAGRTAGRKKLSAGRIAGRIALGLAGLLAVFILYLFIAPLTETDRSAAVPGSADWMADLPDGAGLNEINLPGTHDSATQYCQLAYVTKCQFKRIAEQLEAGFRYLDIRLGADGEDLILMHGFTKCRTGAFFWYETLTLDTVLEDCYAFLKEHPTETVLFCVKQEHGDESVKEFQGLLRRYIAKAPDRWLLTDRIPTVGEARGKLVLLRRYEDEARLGKEAGISCLWDHQGGHENVNLHTAAKDNGTYTLWVQDRYEFNIEDKWAAFTSGIVASSTKNGAAALQFLSTKGTFVQGHPYAFAKVLNARLAGATLLPQDCGWVVVDFGTAELAQKIYSLNAFTR